MLDVAWLYGVFNLSFWGYVVAAFVMVQFTFMAVTLYLHRDATHRSLDLHPVVRHVFRFWLWMSSGINTKEWVAVHRKHHAACETSQDPHSPRVYGLRKVLLEGAELYRAAADDPQLLQKYGRGTPDDWMERHVYSSHRNLGIVLMVVTDLVMFGIPGITLIGVQMLANPLFAAGVINGLGHHTGYRNFECPDAARNVLPWGLLIGGEELHNNHHAFPSSAKFSIRPWEFDIGWFYIRILQVMHAARVIRVAPVPVRAEPKQQVDLGMLRAVIVNRMHVLREYAQHVMIPVFREQLRCRRDGLNPRLRRLFVREPVLLSEKARANVARVLAVNQDLRIVYEFRQRLCALWGAGRLSNEHLLHQFSDWLTHAERSGIQALQEFSQRLRGYAWSPGA